VKTEEPAEKPMSDFEKRRAEMQARRDAKQKELDAIKLGMFWCNFYKRNFEQNLTC
jgi:hypothetical protein